MTDYKHDVAFSFLAKDEGLATEINDRLEGRLSTFLYSRRQEDVVGTDGYETFGHVFEREARTVVVLLGDGWGERRFTLAEKTAIQNRAMHSGQGWSFLQVLPVTKDVKAPAFIPQTFIYNDWQRFGIDAACAIIEAHVTREGGDPKEPTFEAVAARKKRELELQAAREKYDDSQDRLQWFVGEVDRLFARIVEMAHASDFSMVPESSGLMLSVRAPGVNLSVVPERRWQNSPQGCHVRATCYDTSRGTGVCPEAEPATVVVPDLERVGAPAWRGDDRWFSTAQLAEHLMTRLVSHVTLQR